MWVGEHCGVESILLAFNYLPQLLYFLESWLNLISDELQSPSCPIISQYAFKMSPSCLGGWSPVMVLPHDQQGNSLVHGLDIEVSDFKPLVCV